MNGKQQADNQSIRRVTIRIHRAKPMPDHAGAPSGRHRSNPFATDHGPAGPGRRQRLKRWTQDYLLDARPEDTLLDLLLTIKREQDPGLAFRYSCGHGMCGSDGAAVNGKPALLCEATVADCQAYTQAAPFRPTGTGSERRPSPGHLDQPGPFHDPAQLSQDHLLVELGPLPGFPVLRDLIVDTTLMFDAIDQIHPWLQPGPADGALDAEGAATNPKGGPGSLEVRQTKDQLAAYEQLSDCIDCGLCEAACPIWSGGEAFIGPAALVAAARFIHDSRDDRAIQRLEDLGGEDGLSACQSIRACSRPCPRGIDVGETIWDLIERSHHPQQPSHL
ncbi:succinate dehydrogenase/fumarate reductase iron-sulfur subunit [Bifidobacterium xylocopae]|uniref:succinate dehydrogenase n=1 Tax=Bifidobacterium xylocopae TaxID=2493119 RepID=A0A366KEI7_9BIFI|nr:2Fe-2S iron-sulfur cluster-binding protein [Bifidobacterium xylocopae]RBP99989.1 (2Fe-2S)-binding protein [Bifidobacterium xylocopae]